MYDNFIGGFREGGGCTMLGYIEVLLSVLSSVIKRFVFWPYCNNYIFSVNIAASLMLIVVRTVFFFYLFDYGLRILTRGKYISHLYLQELSFVPREMNKRVLMLHIIKIQLPPCLYDKHVIFTALWYN